MGIFKDVETIKTKQLKRAEETTKKKILEKITDYLNVQFVLRNLDENLIPYVMVISEYMTPVDTENEEKVEGYENVICTSSDMRKILSENMGVTEKDVNKIIYKLTKYGVFRSLTDATGKKVRTMYYVADWVFRKDEWPDILTIGDSENSLTERARHFENFSENTLAKNMI